MSDLARQSSPFWQVGKKSTSHLRWVWTGGIVIRDGGSHAWPAWTSAGVFRFYLGVHRKCAYSCLEKAHPQSSHLGWVYEQVLPGSPLCCLDSWVPEPALKQSVAETQCHQVQPGDELLKIQLSMWLWEKKPGLERHMSTKVCQMLFRGQRICGFCRQVGRAGVNRVLSVGKRSQKDCFGCSNGRKKLWMACWMCI